MNDKHLKRHCRLWLLSHLSNYYLCHIMMFVVLKRLSHYDFCQLWRFSPYDVFSPYYACRIMTFVTQCVCRLITFVASLCLLHMRFVALWHLLLIGLSQYRFSWWLSVFCEYIMDQFVKYLGFPTIHTFHFFSTSVVL